MDEGLDPALGVKSRHMLSTSELLEDQAQKSSGLDQREKATRRASDVSYLIIAWGNESMLMRTCAVGSWGTWEKKMPRVKWDRVRSGEVGWRRDSSMGSAGCTGVRRSLEPQQP